MIAPFGDLERSEGRFEGWCWAPDRPRERVVVEIVVNGTVAAAIAAARFSPALRDTGIGDGYHAFSLPMPRLPTRNGASLVEARERASQATFGRLVFRRESLETVYEPRLNALHEAVGSASAALDPLQGRDRTVACDGLRDLGLLLRRLGRSRRPASPPGQVQAALSIAHEHLSSLRPFELPYARSPAVSVVVPAAPRWETTAAALRGIAPTLATLGAELILVDDGACPFHALLRTRIRHLRSFRRSLGPTASLNGAARIARGELLLISTSVKDLGALLIEEGTLWRREEVIVGAQTRALAGAVLEADIFVTDLAAASGGPFLLCKREVFEAIGGLDDLFDDDLPLAALDLALKARLLGVGAASCTPARGSTAPAAATESGCAAFRDRWADPVRFADDASAPGGSAPGSPRSLEGKGSSGPAPRFGVR